MSWYNSLLPPWRAVSVLQTWHTADRTAKSLFPPPEWNMGAAPPIGPKALFAAKAALLLDQVFMAELGIGEPHPGCPRVAGWLKGLKAGCCHPGALPKPPGGAPKGVPRVGILPGAAPRGPIGCVAKPWVSGRSESSINAELPSRVDSSSTSPLELPRS
jgi:hypothetical protein